MKDKIIEVLKKSSYPMRAKYIARQLGVDRTSVNRILYGNINNPFIRSNNFEWSVNGNFHVKHDSYLPTQDLVNQWKDLIQFVTKRYNENSKLFAIEILNFKMDNDLNRVLAEIEVYVMHLLIHIQFKPYEQSIEIEDIHEILLLLKKALIFDYTNSTNAHQYLMKRFQYDDKFITKLLDSFLRYDERNNSLICHEFIRKIEMIGLSICKMNDNKSQMIQELSEIIRTLKLYANSHKNFNVQVKESLVRCKICHESILESNAETDFMGNYYCEDCKDLISDEEDEEDDYEIEEDDIDDEKDEIIEDCTTCYYRKNGSCAKAHLNIVCEKYKYKG